MNLRERTEREIAWRRQFDEVYQAEELILGITEAIEARMKEQGLTKAALAERLKVSPAQVSKLLKADSTNFTVKTLARIAAALDVKLEWDFQPLVPTHPYWSCRVAQSDSGQADSQEMIDALPIAA